MCKVKNMNDFQFKNIFQAERSIKHFIIFLAFAVAVAVFIASKGQEITADVEALESSQSFIVRRQILREGADGRVDKSYWKKHANKNYELRYPPDFIVAVNKSFSTFSSRTGHCKLLVGILGREIDFTIKNQTNEMVNPFSVAILELGDQWVSLKNFRYYLFSDIQRMISVEGEADTRDCLDFIRGMISSFKFIK